MLSAESSEDWYPFVGANIIDENANEMLTIIKDFSKFMIKTDKNDSSSDLNSEDDESSFNNSSCSRSN